MSFNIFQAIPIKPLITSEMISHPLHPNLDPVIALDFRQLSAVANRRLFRCNNFVLDEMILKMNFRCFLTGMGSLTKIGLRSNAIPAVR
jgi:hypothetical protein